MGKSRFKRAHKTHAFNQRAGERYPSRSDDAGSRANVRSGGGVPALYAELCERVPDGAARAELIGVSLALDEAWRRGDRIPVLEAHRKSIERALRSALTKPR